MDPGDIWDYFDEPAIAALHAYKRKVAQRARRSQAPYCGGTDDMVSSLEAMALD